MAKKYVSDDESFIMSVPETASEPVVITSYDEQLTDYEQRVLSDVLKANPDMNLYSVHPSDDSTTDTLTIDRLGELADLIHAEATALKE